MRPALLVSTDDVYVLLSTKAVNSAWKNLKTLASEREGKLAGALQLQEFNRLVLGSYVSRLGPCKQALRTLGFIKIFIPL